jgi:hypothetical protein
MTSRDLDVLDWDAIERVILSPKYLGLQKFVIYIVEVSWTEHGNGCIRRYPFSASVQ